MTERRSREGVRAGEGAEGPISRRVMDYRPCAFRLQLPAEYIRLCLRLSDNVQDVLQWRLDSVTEKRPAPGGAGRESRERAKRW